MNTLESTELESLKDLNFKVKTLKEEIADIEVSLSRLKTKKQSALFEIEVAAEELSKFQAELFEKYGNVTIDLSTGEIKNG
jgi:predicted  nucleic acid-binding Zn-ribbon protein